MWRSTRFWLSPLAGVAVSVALWISVESIHPIFSRFAASGLVPAIIAGTFGGFSSALVAPNRKILISFLVGVFLTGTLLLLFYRHEPAWSRHLWFYWWPIWLIPSFVLGGYLGRRHWQVV
jgi:hypothetical protein